MSLFMLTVKSNSEISNTLLLFALTVVKSSGSLDKPLAPVLKCETVCYCQQNLVSPTKFRSWALPPTVLGRLPHFDFVLILVSSGQVAYPHLIG